MRLLLALLLAALLLGGLYLSTRTAPLADAGRGVEAPGRVESAPPRDAASTEPEPRTPVADVLAQGASPVEEDGEELAATGLEDRPRPPPPAAEGALVERFAGWSSERMSTHLLTLERAVARDQERLFEECFERGLYRVVRFDSAAPEAQLQDVLALEPPPGEVGRTRVVHDPEIVVGTPVTTGEYHFATLARRAHPEFYARIDERDWLRSTLAERQDRL